VRREHRRKGYAKVGTNSKEVHTKQHCRSGYSRPCFRPNPYLPPRYSSERALKPLERSGPGP
jgi:hypothetical protein